MNGKSAFIIKYIILIVFVLGVYNSNAQRSKQFVIYNAIAYKNTPNLSARGLHKLIMIYRSDLVSLDSVQSKLAGSQRFLPDEAKIKTAALNALKTPQVPVCLDIEAWGFKNDTDGEASREKYLQVVNIFRKYNKQNPIGFYGLNPYADNILPYLWSNGKNAMFKQRWLNVNNLLLPVANAINISFPSFYTLRKDDTSSFRKMVQMQSQLIKQQKRDIPVYGFLWPQYHPSSGMANQFIDDQTWKFELETLYKYCDGIVIWGTPYIYDNKKLVYMNWDENANWWKVTQQFITAHQIK